MKNTFFCIFELNFYFFISNVMAVRRVLTINSRQLH